MILSAFSVPEKINFIYNCYKNNQQKKKKLTSDEQIEL